MSSSGLQWCQPAAGAGKRQPGGSASVRLRRGRLLHRTHAAGPGVRDESRGPAGRGHVWLYIHAQSRKRFAGQREEGKKAAHRISGGLSGRGVFVWI